MARPKADPDQVDTAQDQVADPGASAQSIATQATQPSVDPMHDIVEVIIQRPYGVTDSHAFFGFNGIEGQYAYDKPVKMPRAMVEHLRSARSVEYRPGADGNPVPSYTNSFSIVDAKR